MLRIIVFELFQYWIMLMVLIFLVLNISIWLSLLPLKLEEILCYFLGYDHEILLSNQFAAIFIFELFGLINVIPDVHWYLYLLILIVIIIKWCFCWYCWSLSFPLKLNSPLHGHIDLATDTEAASLWIGQLLQC